MLGGGGPRLLRGGKGAPATRPSCRWASLTAPPLLLLLQQQQLMLLLLGVVAVQQGQSYATATGEPLRGGPSTAWMHLGPPQVCHGMECSRPLSAAAAATAAAATTAAAAPIAARAAAATTAAAAATAARSLHRKAASCCAASQQLPSEADASSQQQQQQQQRQQQEQQEMPSAGTLKAKLLQRVCLMGRPNVGKSCLFNRITASNSSAAAAAAAIVSSEAGTTRDTLLAAVRWNEVTFEVADTGGLTLDRDLLGPLASQLEDQVTFALQQAACAVLVVDGREGIHSDDEHMAELLRRLKIPIVLCVNKCENAKASLAAAQAFWKLGLGEPFACSAISGTGVAELLDSCRQHGCASACMPLHVCVCLCRPNAGKSALLNCLSNSQRSLVSALPGTTRDAVDEFVLKNNKVYCLVDTAGLRRASLSRRSPDLERHSAIRAKTAAARADVCLLVVDGTVGISREDVKLAEMLEAQGRAVVVLINKWDVALQTDEFKHQEAVEYVRRLLYPVAWADVLFVSGLTGHNISKIWGAVDAATQQHRRRLTTALLNFVLRDAMAVFPPALTKDGKRGKVYLAQQVATQPPTIVLFCNKGEFFPQVYRRYLDFSVRSAFRLASTPIRGACTPQGGESDACDFRVYCSCSSECFLNFFCMQVDIQRQEDEEHAAGA
ncbi:hypothetical protein Efla_000031 [Eimeria flavescens]